MTPTSPAKDPVIGTTLSGYRVERLMGAGGMGLVYLARHEFIDRRFAVKALKPEIAADVTMARNFHREAQVLSALKHPNIVDIVGFGALPDGRHYMVMEFLEGRTLEDELLEQGRVTPERALVLADQILLALEAAHEAGVIHRDLKPSNVFLNKASGGVEVVKLLDFGLARQRPVALAGLQAEAGQTMIAGTPDYIAPEQARGELPGPGCDLYSFGVLFFELLAGQRPFSPAPGTIDRVMALLRAHLEATPPTLKELGVPVPDALSELVAQCLEKQPSARPRSAAEVRARLAAFRPATPAGPLALQPPAAATPTAPIDDAALAAAVQQRSWKGPALVAAALVVILAALVAWTGQGPSEPAAPAAAERQDPQPAAAASPPAAVATTAPAAPPPTTAAPAPPEATSDDELAALPTLRAKAATPSKKPSARNETVVVRVEKSDCEPDDRWRAASRVHLQELQSLAAGDDARWSEFERVEPTLSHAITNAVSGAQCDAVEQQIRRLALKWKK